MDGLEAVHLLQPEGPYSFDVANSIASAATFAMEERHANDDVEKLRRCCVAHDHWLATHPESVAFAESWADQALS
ncbi:hypothetical protein AWC21_03075 [Mycolicibacterium peregrinum]|nr:hypothetical protein AWC21_03075 [Mycolicibacterium peregrinum]